MTAAKKAAPAKKAAAKKTTTPVKPAESPTGVQPEIKDPIEQASPDVQRGVEKVKIADKKLELGSPAERRANYLAALEEELDMCERAGKSDRVSAIKDEIKRAKSGVSGRSTGPQDEA